LPDIIYLKFAKFCKNENLVAKNDKIIVSLSGGADSVLLLHFLLKLKSRYSLQIIAVHMDHQLRNEESDRDRNFCVELCESLGVELIVRKLSVHQHSKQQKISTEMAARELRYETLKKMSIERGFDKVATGHNLDDNAETVILNLIKGKGVLATAGIPVKRGNIIRPLLSLSKEDIIAYLRQKNLNFVSDSSNLDSIYQRNLLRHEVFPQLRKINPKMSESIYRFSEMLRSVTSSVLQSDTATTVVDNDTIEIDVSLANKSNDFSLYNELSIRFIELFSLNLKFENFYTLRELFRGQSGKKITLGEILFAQRTREKVLVSRVFDKTEQEVILSLDSQVKFDNYFISCTECNHDSVIKGGNKNIEFIDGDSITDHLTVRAPHNGEWFYPLNGNGKRKISDFFNDVKLNTLSKWNHPVVYSGEKIVWVCGYRLDDRFKIKTKTKRIYKLEIELYG